MSSKEKARKSRRKFLIGLAGMGAFAYILYRYYPDLLTLIQKLDESGKDAGDVKPDESGTPSDETPSFEGVVVSPPSVYMARPYLVITEVIPSIIMSPGGYPERSNTYVKIQNWGYSPSLSTVLEIYLVQRNFIPPERDDSWLRNGWMENAYLLEKRHFQIYPRSTVKHQITFPDIARNVMEGIIYLVYDEAFDPRETDLVAGQRKFASESIGWL